MRDYSKLNPAELTVTANTALGLFLRLKLGPNAMHPKIRHGTPQKEKISTRHQMLGMRTEPPPSRLSHHQFRNAATHLGGVQAETTRQKQHTVSQQSQQQRYPTFTAAPLTDNSTQP
jgi:hypothetical protein